MEEIQTANEIEIIDEFTDSESPVPIEDVENKGVIYKLSRAISGVLHPFVVPTITVLLLLFGNTIMSGVPERLKLLFVAIIVLNTIVVPTLFILLLRSFNYIPNFSLNQRRDRIAPLVVVTICYIICAFMISDALVAFLIRKFLFAAVGCVLLGLVVSFFWKISLHMISAGGALALLFIINISGFGNMLWVLIVGVLLTGALASARLYLGLHTPLQVTAGFVGGFIVACAVMLKM